MTCTAQPSNRAGLKFAGYFEKLQLQYHWLPTSLGARYARTYGIGIHTLLTGRGSPAQMG
jgi:glycerol-3-phosphate dehydrogenase